MSVFRDHWSWLILRDLLEKPRRFSELKKSLVGVSAKILSERLSALQSFDVVDRTVSHKGPVKVVYSLTKKGRNLDNAMRAIKIWGEKWMPLPKNQKFSLSRGKVRKELRSRALS